MAGMVKTLPEGSYEGSSNDILCVWRAIVPDSTALICTVDVVSRLVMPPTRQRLPKLGCGVVPLTGPKQVKRADDPLDVEATGSKARLKTDRQTGSRSLT